MSSNANSKPNYAHLSRAADDPHLSAWWLNDQPEDSRLSRAEREDSDAVREVCVGIAETLDIWRPDPDCESVDEFIFDLADHLEKNADWEVEVRPDTQHGTPHLLVGDRLALELRLNPDKGERNRLIGQSTGYSSHWVMWIVLINTNSRQINELARLLSDEGLGRILIWSFP